MSESSIPSSAEGTPARSSGRAASRDETDLLDVLKLLIATKKAKSTGDLVKYAGQYGAVEAEQRLRLLEAEGIPLNLAFDAISVHLRILAFKRSSSLVGSCRGKKVGMVLPMPHHLLDIFMPVAKVTLLHPGDTPLHGPVQEHEAEMIKGTRACRTAASGMEVLIFEGFREGEQLFVDASVADALEPKLLPGSVALLAHLRPHRNPQDIEYSPGSEVAYI